MVAVSTSGLLEALDLEFSLRGSLDDIEADLTTDHPSSSRGLPVLVKNGVAYGPGDLPGVTIHLYTHNPEQAEMIESARAAGWTVNVSDYQP